MTTPEIQGRDIYDDCVQDLQVIVSDVDNVRKLVERLGYSGSGIDDCRARIDRAVNSLAAKLRKHVEGCAGSGCSYALRVADEMRAAIEDPEKDRPLRRWQRMLLGYEPDTTPEPPPISESEAIRRATLAAMNPEAAAAERRAWVERYGPAPNDDWRKVATNRRHRIAELEAEVEKLKIIAEATKAYIESEDQDRVEEFDDMEASVKDYYESKPGGS